MKNLEKILVIFISLAILTTALVFHVNVVAEPETGTNLVSGRVPVQFSAAGSLANIGIYNDRTLRYFPETGIFYNGYSPDNTDTKDTWSGYVANMTDSSATTGTGIRQQYEGDYLAIVYQFDSAAVHGFSITSVGTHSKLINVYISNTYSGLFHEEHKIFSGNTADNFKNTSEINTEGCYIAFVTKDREFTIYDLAVYGEANTSNSTEVANVLSDGQIPVQFNAAGSLANIANYNDRTLRYFPESGAFYNGYSPDNTDTKDKWSGYVANMTDADSTTGTGIRQQYDGDYLAIVYKLDQTTVKGFSVTSVGTHSKLINVYVANTHAGLFDEKYKVFTGNTADNFKNTSEINAEGAYIAFVTKDREFTIYDIKVYGTVETEEPGTGEEYTDILTKNQIPVQFSATGSAGNFSSYNDRTLRYFPESGVFYNGYSPKNTDTKSTWSEYLANMTDHDDETGTGIRQQYDGDYLVIVYQFDPVTVKGFSIKSVGTHSKPISVYVSDAYENLFSDDHKVYSGETADECKNSSAISANGSYIAFATKDREFTIYGISVYGTAIVEEPEEPLPENSVTRGIIPVAFYSAPTGTTTYSWHDLRSTPSNLKGYNKNSKNDDIKTKFFNNWSEKIGALTDGDASASLLVKPESYYSDHDGTYEDVLIVFAFEETASITGVQIDTKPFSSQYPSFASVEMYVSKNLDYLFAQTPLVITSQSNQYKGELSADGITYVGFRLKESDCYIKEISVLGEFKEYVRPDYGTNLIAGKLPMSLFIAERDYPLPHTADRIYKVLEDKERTNTLAMLTDGDFSKAFSWYHDHNYTNVNKNSRYKVIAYDLGSVSTVVKILIDSKCGGYDIFVSDDYNHLYDPDQTRVYTSGGDKLLPDGSALDPSTDLIPGENLIELSGVSGRYVGIVITRGSRLDKADNESVEITEIQIFGKAGNSNFGDNLISGKVPIFNYRAKYGKYTESLGESFVENPGASAFTDGDLTKNREMILPNNGGLLSYDYGANVMIYYLEGECDVRAFSLNSFYYYAPGGLDVYISDTFDTLFSKDSCVFTTGGETAVEKVYDPTKDLGAISISASLKAPKSGRYAAFVITRFYDSKIAGWGQLQMSELQLFGTMNKSEKLPSTTLTDKNSGTSVTFIYQNPDDNFKFAQKGIGRVELKSVPASEYQNDVFKKSLASNRLKLLGDAFYLQFYDKNGKLISYSELQEEYLSITFKFSNSAFRRLVEIRNDSAYLIKQAEQHENTILLKTDDFDRLFAYVSVLSNETEFAALPVFSDPSSIGDSYSPFENGGMFGWNSGENAVTDDGVNAEEIVSDNGNSVGKESKKALKVRKWIANDVEDPLEWFWNIYDTFAANLWMLIVSIGVLLVSIAGIIFEVIILKRRKRV